MSVLLPALGPRLVFFTGGTALRGLSRSLTRYTHNSVHLVTPFDSGGSSAALREAFALPAVGDIRNRLAALADSMIPQSVLDFWEMRLPAEGDSEALRARLRAMGSAGHPCWRPLPSVMADVMRVHLGYFLERMPDDFRPQKASMGNLLLAGGYLHFQRNFTPVLSLFSRLLQVRGVVLPIVNACLHLAAELADGSVLVGQHHFCRLTQPVRRLYLTVHEPGRTSTALTPCRPPLSATAATYLQSAGAICYPMGSFYTSVLSNLLPDGVGRAVAAARCPKIYIPNSGKDTEAQGLTLTAQVDMLLRHLQQDAPQAGPGDLLHAVLLDSRHGRYPGGIEWKELERRGIDAAMVAAEWCNMPEAIKLSADHKVGHMLQITTPDLGGINNTIEAVLYCKEKGIGAYQGGTCNETDRSAQVCVQCAMATQPAQILAKPGMGVDEGYMIVYNEMNRILALRKAKAE